MDHAGKLKFGSYVHLPSSKNVSMSLRLSDSAQCRGDYFFSSMGSCTSALEHIRMLIFNSYVLLACINTFFINMATLV